MPLQQNGILSRPVLNRCALRCQTHRSCCQWQSPAGRRADNFSTYRLSPILGSRRRWHIVHSKKGCLHGRRENSSLTNAHSQDIAVLGGGITGMVTTYFLSEIFSKSNIVLFESKDILGGWIRSQKVDVGDGEIIFEQAVRSLRPNPPNGTLALRLIQELGLVPELLITPRSSPAARNRFIFYPDHLVRMPGPGPGLLATIISNLWTVITEPVFKNAISGLMHDAGGDTRALHIEDESVGDFVSRRFNADIANNIVSALFHGIYAGDIYKLSARQTMAQLWTAEVKHGDLTSYMVDQGFRKQTWNFCDDLDLQMKLQDAPWDTRITEEIPNASVFTLQKGMGQLAKTLEKKLLKRKNVEVLCQTQVEKIEEDGKDSLKVVYRGRKSGKKITRFSHIVSTIAPKGLIPMLPEIDRPVLNKTLASTPASTVMVVNLYFRTPNILTTLNPPGGLPRTETGDIRGFGYLIPATVPFEQNPERALGVIFDSDITPDMWTTVPAKKIGTRLTVMLGGHWWNDWSSYPSEAEGKDMALDVLARHLGLIEEPIASHVSLQHDCIPQYEVGHAARMGRAHDALLKVFGGKLRVAGSWYSGVGVNDCIRSAFDVTAGLASDLPQASPEGKASILGNALRSVAGRNDRTINRGERTGLESFKHGRPLALVKRSVPGTVEIVELEERAREMGYFARMSSTGEDVEREGGR